MENSFFFEKEPKQCSCRIDWIQLYFAPTVVESRIHVPIELGPVPRATFHEQFVPPIHKHLPIPDSLLVPFPESSHGRHLQSTRRIVLGTIAKESQCPVENLRECYPATAE